jgi:glucosamine--fructose-6-phosphate aminotransferase (isomerizing)
VHALSQVPRHVSTLLRKEAIFERLAHELAKARDVLYLGRGVSYPIAPGGRPKVEGNLLHSRRGLCRRRAQAWTDRARRRERPVIVVAPEDELFEKTVSNMQEVAARGGKIILISDAAPARAGCKLEAHIPCPRPMLLPHR